jgi:uncharacterized protein (DUF488 family)
MIYTIGHSNHPIEPFIGLLHRHEIGALADVRSTPFSRFNPQFNRERLAAELRAAGIHYVFLGAELGARSKDPECHEGGRVSYAKLARTEPFRRGLERVLSGMREHRIALMCAEREPLECHRTILIARELERAGVPVTHILADGSLQTHAQAMDRLVTHLKLADADLFASPAQRVEAACELQGRKMGFAPKH